MPTPLPFVPSDASIRTPVDWLLGGLGVSAATVSATFAIYMAAFGPGMVATRGDFPVFAAWDRRERAPAADTASDASQMRSESGLSAAAPAPEPSPKMSAVDIDFTPTGSVAPRVGTAEAGSALRRDVTDRAAGPARLRLRDFTVRDVFDGKAVIETRNRLRIVEPGSMLEDAGRVLAIRREGGGWVIETSTGIVSN